MGFLLIPLKFLGGFLGKLLSDWRVILVLAILAATALALWKFKSLEEKLVTTEQARAQVQANYDNVKEANLQNELVIQQLEADKKLALQSSAALSADIAKTNNSINGLKNRLDELTTPPTKLTPYIAEAIDGAQQLRSQGEQP